MYFIKYCFNMYSFSFVNENVKLASMELGMFFMFSACLVLEYHVFVKI